jgi:hypothetical protein
MSRRSIRRRARQQEQVIILQLHWEALYLRAVRAFDGASQQGKEGLIGRWFTWLDRRYPHNMFLVF